MPINLNKIKELKGGASAKSGGISLSGIEKFKKGKPETVKKTDAREVMAKKTAAGVATGKLTAKKDDNKLTLSKVAEAVKRIPAALTNRESQQAIRQPIWNAIDKAAAFNDVQGTEMRKYAFGDTRPYDEGYAPTTGNETADTIARTAGMVSSPFVPSGGGAPSMSMPVRNAAEYVANKVAPKVGNVVGRVGNVALRGSLESLPYTAQQLFVGDKKSIKDMAKIAGKDLIFGVVTELGIEGAGELFKAIGTKMKKGVSLTAKEKAIVDEASKPTEIIDDAEKELQDAITTPRPAEAEQLAEELRNAEPIVQPKINAGQVNTPTVNKVAQKGVQDGILNKGDDLAKNKIDYQKYDGVAGTKVADEKGNPIKVYHGSIAQFEEFDKNLLGKTTGTKSAKEGFFFAGNKSTADVYSTLDRDYDMRFTDDDIEALKIQKVDVLNETRRVKALITNLKYGLETSSEEFGEVQKDVLNAISETRNISLGDGNLYLEYQKAMDILNRYLKKNKGTLQTNATFQPTLSELDKLVGEIKKIDVPKGSSLEGRTKELYLNMQNPFYYDFKGKWFRDKSYADIIEKAKKDGHDGVIFQNTFDGSLEDDIYVVFDTKQIVSDAQPKVTTPKVDVPAKSNVIEFKPKTPNQTKYVEQVTAKLPNDADGLSKKIAELEAKAAKETDKSKLLKINLQAFAAKTKLREISVKPLPINQAVGDISTARQKVSYDYKPPKSGQLWEKVRTEFTDKYAPLERLEKDVRGKIPSAEKSLYKQARLSAGIPERANRIIESELKPIIKGIEAKGHSYKDLGLYAEAVHAKDVNAAGMVSGFSDSEIEDIITKLGNPTMEDARKKLVEYSNKRLQLLVDNDVISQKAFYAMKDKWKNYMPLNRVMDDDKVEFVKGLKDSFVNVANPIKGLKGSQRQIVDPIESMIKNTYKIEHAAGMNKVGGMLDRLSMIDEQGTFIRKLKPGEEVGRKNVVNIKVNGESVGYEVDPEVYKAMKAMGKESSNLLIKVLAKPASVLRAGATLTVDFASRNPIRDVFNAFMFSESGFNPFTDFTAGLASYIKKGKYYDEFLKNNGGYGNIISMDRQAHREAVKRIVKQTPTEKFVNVINPKSWVEVMRNISDATESATKIGEFRAALRSGATPQEAAYRARDLMDFARSGNSVKEVNKVVAFLNANIQGKSKLIRAIKENPAKVSTKLFATMALPSIGAYAATYYLAGDKQKATIKDAPDWLRDSFWLVPVPLTDTVARIPKPFEGAAVANTLERLLSYVQDNDKDAFDGFIKATVSEQSIPVMLSGAAPIIEGMTNYSFFRQAPLIPQREKYLLPKDQYDIYTSEVSKLLAGGVGKILPESNFASPRIMDNTIKGATAGLGTYVLDATDKVLGKNKPAKNASQLPGIKAFTANENSTGKAVNFVYDELDKVTKERTSYRNNNPKTKGKYSKEKQYDFLNDVSSEISGISKEIRAVQNDKDMKPKEKRAKINELSQKRNDVARAAQEKYKKGDYSKLK